MVTTGGVGALIFCTPPEKGPDSFFEKKQLSPIILPCSKVSYKRTGKIECFQLMEWALNEEKD